MWKLSVVHDDVEAGAVERGVAEALEIFAAHRVSPLACYSALVSGSPYEGTNIVDLHRRRLIAVWKQAESRALAVALADIPDLPASAILHLEGDVEVYAYPAAADTVTQGIFIGRAQTLDDARALCREAGYRILSPLNGGISLLARTPAGIDYWAISVRFDALPFHPSAANSAGRSPGCATS